MPLLVGWDDIAIRLLLTVVASAAMGLDRGARGHAAGLRTTILVGLAAAVAMIQMNMLLPVDGKTPASFSVMDIMRLPLGILTGVGFIGGGTILKRGDLVTGVTTAATLWIVTVIGLCFGGGQIGLGVAASLLGVATLWPLKWIDDRLPRQHRGTLVVSDPAPERTARNLPARLAPLGCTARFRRRSKRSGGEGWSFTFEVTWRGLDASDTPLALLAALDGFCTIDSFEITSEARH